MYVVIWIILIVCFPSMVISAFGSGESARFELVCNCLSCVAFVVNILVLVFIAIRTSSERLSFWTGMNLLAAKSETGCLRLSLIVVPIYLTIMYIMAIFMSVIGLARDKSFTENWWLNRVIGKVRTPKPTESVLSVEEEALIFNASMPGLDVKQLSDLRLISEQTGIDPKRILDHASQNPGSYKRWKNAAKIDRRARWERRLRSVSISKNFGNAQKIYVWLLFINLFAATSSLLWSDAVTMTLWKFEGILILGMMPYSWIVQRVLAATPCELSY